MDLFNETFFSVKHVRTTLDGDNTEMNFKTWLLSSRDAMRARGTPTGWIIIEQCKESYSNDTN